jgi:predicted nucleotidyltransferase
MSVFEALGEVCSFLEEQGVPYAVIGGLAVQHWGEPRATRDIDIVAMVQSHRQEEFLNAIVQRFHPRLPDAVPFAQRHGVLLVTAANGVPVDISLGIPGYEEEVMRRAIRVAFPGTRPVRLVTAEDLIIHKCVAGRPRDLEDIERILIRQGPALDLAYVRRWLREFAAATEDAEVCARFEDAVKGTRAARRRKGPS